MSLRNSGTGLMLAGLAISFVTAASPGIAQAQDCPPDFSGDCGSMPPEWTQVMGGDPTDPYSPIVGCGDPTCPENKDVVLSTCACPSR